MTKQWNEMTTAEKNLAIAELVYPDEELEVIESWVRLDMVDYLNNWNDLMPLVVEHKISLSPEYYDDKGVTELWDAESFTRPYVLTTNKSPQEAACECLWNVLKEKCDE